MILKKLAILFILFIVYACSDSDEPEILTPEDAKAAIVENTTNLTTDIVGITQSEGADALIELINLTNLADPFNGRSSMTRSETYQLLKKKSLQFKSIFIPRESVNLRTDQHGGFDFEANWGIYEWIPLEEDFIKISSEGEMIIIRFPTEGSQTNNAELRITGYSEKLITYEEDGFVEEDYYPTLITADLSIDGELMVDLILEAAYNDFGDPVSADISLFVNPYRFTLNFDDTNNLSASLSASISKNDNIIVSVSVEVIFANQEKEDVSVLEGFVQYLDLKISGRIDVAGLEEIDNLGEGDPNEFINLQLTIGSQVAGNIILVEEVDDSFPEETEWVPYVEYSDGSRERLEDILEETIIELENFFDEIG